VYALFVTNSNGKRSGSLISALSSLASAKEYTITFLNDYFEKKSLKTATTHYFNKHLVSSLKTKNQRHALVVIGYA
jgi:hypothetical protein